MSSPTTISFAEGDQTLRFDATDIGSEEQHIEFPAPPLRNQQFDLASFLLRGESRATFSVISAQGIGRTVVGRDPDMIARALRRLEDLPKIVTDSVEAGEEDFEQPPSVSAMAAASATLRRLAKLPVESAIGLFPTTDGGIALQAVGPSRTVSVEIAPHGQSMLAKYASKDVYHRETLNDIEEAAHFLATHTR